MDGIFEILDAEFRWVLIGSFFITFSISKLYRQRARRVRQNGREIRRGDENIGMVLARLIVALPLFAGVFSYMVNPEWMAWAHVELPVWMHSTGAIMLIMAIPMGYWVMSSLGENVSETILTRPGQTLIQHGPYRWIRHPLYTNGLLLFMGAGLGAENAFILFFTVLTWYGVYSMVIPKEEEQLVLRFGKEYETYMLATGKLFPRIKDSEAEVA
jgi:protein-S-isoprenylcysteine O-methyltransferase Ste14